MATYTCSCGQTTTPPDGDLCEVCDQPVRVETDDARMERLHRWLGSAVLDYGCMDPVIGIHTAGNGETLEVLGLTDVAWLMGQAKTAMRVRAALGD